MGELGTIIKQMNRETYLDLTNADLAQDNFVKDFKKFTKEKAAFLDGTTLSLILPDDFSEKDEKLASALEQIQKELNRRNISLKRSKKNVEASENQSEIEASPVKEEAKQAEAKIEKKKAELKTETKAADSYDPLPQDLRSMLARGNTLYVKSSMRAGQEIQHPGDVVVFGDVKHSAEIVASGDIIVWGKLKGIVHAGAEGNAKAIVAALSIDEGQIRISDKLVAISPDTSKKSKEVREFVPEIAKIVDNEIQIERFSNR